jgi:lipoate-protein ligase A
MRFVDNRGVTDPRRNLALEEYVLRTFRDDESYLLFYINAPSVIIGRNQNTIEEINPDYVRENGIHVVRRISGGGAVYHDTGNLNFSMVAPYTPEDFNRYEKFTRPVIEVLREMGVPAELGTRNDILVEGRKVSGNAQFVSRGRMFSHGTLLVHSDLSAVDEALRPRPEKVESRSHKSVRSRVANISEFLDEPIDAPTLRDRIIERAFSEAGSPADVDLTEAGEAEISRLAAEKYGSWEWNYGQSPPFTVQRERRLAAGLLELRIQVVRGKICSVEVVGDFGGCAGAREVEAHLSGVTYERGAIAQALARLDPGDCFGTIPTGELAGLVCD